MDTKKLSTLTVTIKGLDNSSINEVNCILSQLTKIDGVIENGGGVDSSNTFRRDFIVDKIRRFS